MVNNNTSEEILISTNVGPLSYCYNVYSEPSNKKFDSDCETISKTGWERSKGKRGDGEVLWIRTLNCTHHTTALRNTTPTALHPMHYATLHKTPHTTYYTTTLNSHLCTYTARCAFRNNDRYCLGSDGSLLGLLISIPLCFIAIVSTVVRRCMPLSDMMYGLSCFFYFTAGKNMGCLCRIML